MFNIPKASVVMTTYNDSEYLIESIQSVLNQTFIDFEFIIVNDGSTDKTIDIINSFDDPRIIIINNLKNMGTSYSSNRAIEIARGEYIFRADSDDINYPNRFETQIQFMEGNKNIDICGSWADRLYDSGEIDLWSYPSTHNEILVGQLFYPNVIHPTLIIRRKVFLEHDITYDERISLTEDYNLFVRLIPKVNYHNIPECLIKYRKRKGSLSFDNNKNKPYLNRARLIALSKLEIFPTEKELEYHWILHDRRKLNDSESILQIVNWAYRLLVQNEKLEIYNQNILTRFITEKLKALTDIQQDLILETFELLNEHPINKYITNFFKFNLNIKKILSNNTNSEVYIYGFGTLGYSTYKFFVVNDITVNGIIDNNLTGKLFDSYEIGNKEELVSRHKTSIVIITILNNEVGEEVIEDLIKMGFHIDNLYKIKDFIIENKEV
ncbi:glycosyltransferase family 2 protein [Sporosarcina sp. FSL K6-3457]|uniref:glycosyltransferase family 2 protein n=1 Tax=Sporosarcina sp. FSL K6-3457 TaxID=2978204 RepID=UPI0030FAD52A